MGTAPGSTNGGYTYSSKINRETEIYYGWLAFDLLFIQNQPSPQAHQALSSMGIAESISAVGIAGTVTGLSYTQATAQQKEDEEEARRAAEAAQAEAAAAASAATTSGRNNRNKQRSGADESGPSHGTFPVSGNLGGRRRRSQGRVQNGDNGAGKQDIGRAVTKGRGAGGKRQATASQSKRSGDTTRKKGNQLQPPVAADSDVPTSDVPEPPASAGPIPTPGKERRGGGKKRKAPDTDVHVVPEGGSVTVAPDVEHTVPNQHQETNLVADPPARQSDKTSSASPSSSREFLPSSSTQETERLERSLEVVLSTLRQNLNLFRLLLHLVLVMHSEPLRAQPITFHRRPSRLGMMRDEEAEEEAGDPNSPISNARVRSRHSRNQTPRKESRLIFHFSTLKHNSLTVQRCAYRLMIDLSPVPVSRRGTAVTVTPDIVSSSSQLKHESLLNRSTRKDYLQLDPYGPSPTFLPVSVYSIVVVALLKDHATAAENLSQWVQRHVKTHFHQSS
ncbi:hypothetical protein F5880DRAFT_1508611 [Lentinula raphanica]|nr:hypothetical protein F5880DRAFT_1508611 [Lentinula raphanica]